MGPPKMLVTVATFLDPWEAQVVRARLEADGIPATVAYTGHAVLNWPLTLALGGTPVQVPDRFVAQSRKILADYQSGVLQAELNEATGADDEHCPHCGSIEIERTMLLRKRLFALFVMLVLAPFPTRRSRCVCKRCGCQWEWGGA